MKMKEVWKWTTAFVAAAAISIGMFAGSPVTAKAADEAGIPGVCDKNV